PRQPAEAPKPFERRTGRVINEIAPVAMLRRPAPGKDRWNAGGAVTENGGQSLAQRREVSAKGIVFNNLPPAGINEHEERQNRFHQAYPKFVQESGEAYRV